MSKCNNEAMTREAYEELRNIFLVNTENETDAKLLTALSKKIATREHFVLGAFVAWERPGDDAPIGIPLTGGEVLFFGDVSNEFKDQAKKTLGVIVANKLFISGLLHKQDDNTRSKQVDIVHRCTPPCAISGTSNNWYCNNLLANLCGTFKTELEKGIAEQYRKVVEGISPYADHGYFPEKDKSYIIIYCPFLVIDGRPPGNYFGVYECVSADQTDLLDHLAAIQHAGTLIYARRAIESKAREILEHATKAAVSAIMSRNMSHNIGSHVLSYWGNKLKKATDEIDTQRETLSSCLSAATKALSANNIPIIAKELQNINNIRKKQQAINHYIFRPSESLFDYLKKRMDFIAEITTTLPAWEKTLSLKKDLLEVFQCQFAILDNIARSEGFCYAPEFKSADPDVNKILSQYACKKINDKWGKCRNNGNICGRLPEESRKEDACDSEPQPIKIEYEGNDCPVSIPHGVVGKQAFYSILENFIRNSAKHGGAKVKNDIKSDDGKNALVFTIKAKEAEENGEWADYIKVTLSDNIGNCAEEIDRDDEDKIVRVIDRLKKAVRDNEYIDPKDGRIKKGSWGIKEMKVSANFLRKREVDALLEEKEEFKEPPLIKLTCFDDSSCSVDCLKNKNETNVAMTFYLRKPKEVFIVKRNSSRIKDNKKWGIETCTIEEFKERVNSGEAIPHRFLLFESYDETAVTLAMNNRVILPSRIVINSVPDGASNKQWKWKEPAYTQINNFNNIEDSPAEFSLELYEKFLKNKMMDGSNNLALVFIRNLDNNWKVEDICDVGDSLPETGLANLIIFDNHHDKIEVDGDNKITGPVCKYYQGVSAGTSSGIFLKNAPDNVVDKKVILRELAESSMVKVLIADERIWRNSQGKLTVKSGKMAGRIDLLEKMGIFLVPVSDGTISESEKNRILNNSYSDITFFVIHQGLIDKMKSPDHSSRKKNHTTKVISGTQFIRCAVHKFPYVIIDSGRGEPEELEPGTRYIPMSAIENFLDELDKYSLVQTLFSVRRSTRGKNR